MSKRTFMLVHETARENAAKFARNDAPDGWMATFSQPTKKRIQEEKYHAMMGDISKQCTFMNEKRELDDWKRLLVDAFAKVMRDAGTPIHHDGRVLPSLDFERVVQLGIQTKDFYVAEAAQFIEYLYAFGADRGVVWSEPKQKELQT
ncbi:MAG: recombination protein NinB [Polaromonas sp.]|uniref:recombination protein NinB n=1 Tax=Polaromonas sp. TaxID=1869339 RepID=UPI0025EB208A|nr:recombination protein NinB [Polaromonas sp.]MBI2725410.1 recombination protein NinB [Polaromonas sp.]